MTNHDNRPGQAHADRCQTWHYELESSFFFGCTMVNMNEEDDKVIHNSRKKKIPATQLTTSLCCRMLCTILPSFRDITRKLFSQLPHVIKKFSDGICNVVKHCFPSSIFSAKGVEILHGERTSEPIPKKGSCKS